MPAYVSVSEKSIKHCRRLKFAEMKSLFEQAWAEKVNTLKELVDAKCLSDAERLQMVRELNPLKNSGELLIEWLSKVPNFIYVCELVGVDDPEMTLGEQRDVALSAVGIQRIEGEALKKKLTDTMKESLSSGSGKLSPSAPSSAM